MTQNDAQRRPGIGKQTSRRRSTDRAPGRPSADQAGDVRDALLDAAARLFATQGFRGTSLRSVAAAADVTPAMVHYYFGNKSGLYQALLARTFDGFLPRFADLGEIRSSDALIDRIFAVVHGAMVPQPWIPQLLLREVLSDGGHFRETFVERFAAQVAPTARDALARGQARGELRADLDPTLVYLCLVGMVLFPILGRAVFERIFGRSLGDEDLLTELRRTTKTLFLEGVAERDETATA